MHKFSIPKSCVNWPLKKIARVFKCSLSTASVHRQRLGNVRLLPPWEKVDWHKLSTTEISKALGQPRSAVSRKRAELAPETLARFKPKK